ncbi:MAG: acyl carrier protein [Lysobacterales bacterium]
MNSETTESVAGNLAGMLAEYLENNWVDSPAPAKPIDADTNMVTGLQLDSFQVMEFMLEVEDHFDVAIDLESLSGMQTIRDLAGVVVKAQEEM